MTTWARLTGPWECGSSDRTTERPLPDPSSARCSAVAALVNGTCTRFTITAWAIQTCFGLQGPTGLSFTAGGAPARILYARYADWSWFDTSGARSLVSSCQKVSRLQPAAALRPSRFLDGSLLASEDMPLASGLPTPSPAIPTS